MTREVVKTDKVTVEETTIFTSADGIEFNTEEKCREYENSLRKVLDRRIVSQMKRFTEYSMTDWFGSEDWYYGIIKVTKDNLKELTTWANVNDCYFREKLKDTEVAPLHECIGKTVVFSLGWVNEDMSPDWVTYMGEVSTFKDFLIGNINKALG